MNRFPWFTKIALFLRGWRSGRNALTRLQLPDSLELFPAAKRVLQEFGGLTYGPSNDYLGFDPNLPQDIIEEVHRYEKLIGRRLYPIGYCKHQEFEPVLIDESGDAPK